MDFTEDLPDLATVPSSSKSPVIPDYGHRKILNNESPSTCLVCLHPATGYHYDVASCNGCKAFFRRTIINANRFKCIHSQDCFDSKYPIDRNSLRCRSCRFRKCVAVGMHPSAIQYRLSERAQDFVAEFWDRVKTRDQKSDETPSTSSALVFPDEIVSRKIGKLNTIEQISSKIHDDGLPNGFYDLRTLEEILSSSMVHCNSDIPNMEKRASIHHNGIYAHCSFLASVEYSKTFDFYGNITMNDKIRLARHVIVACSTLHDAYFSINSLNSDCPRFPSGVRIGEKKERGNISSIFAKTFIAMFRNKLDRAEYMLLKAIVLCNPAVCSLTPNGQSFLDKERRLYGYCLLRYCRLRYGTIHGASRFAELLSITPILENQVKLLKDVQKFVMVTTTQNKQIFTNSNLFNEVLDS